jgi:lactoylglutathione lyase
MKITHIAIWTNNLELLRDFYCSFFDAKSNAMYTNPVKQFNSYFLTFETGGCSLELMSKPNLNNRNDQESKALIGLAHFAFSAGSKEKVDLLTEQFRESDYKVISEPRYTGDGFYESAINDPDGNIVEITI